MHERPRPIPVPDLETRADEVAKRWLLALLDATPLAAASRVPVEAIAAEGPAFCAAVLRAVGSDDDLAGLLASDAGDLARLAGAGDAPAAVAAAEALRRAVQEVAAAATPSADAAGLAPLADRLAHVCARLAAAGLVRDDPSYASEIGVSRLVPDESDAFEDLPLPEAAPAGAGPSPLWLAALERQIASGGRFALLLVEIDGVERLLPAEGEEATRELLSRAGRAVRGRLRRPDLLAHEQDGRMWIIAPDSGREGTASLAARVADEIEGAVASRGVPLTASVGVALYPDDGRAAAELTGQAEEGAYAARAAGVRVADHPGAPVARGPRPA